MIIRTGENLTQRERIGFKTSREVGHGKKSSLTGTPEQVKPNKQHSSSAVDEADYIVFVILMSSMSVNSPFYLF